MKKTKARKLVKKVATVKPVKKVVKAVKSSKSAKVPKPRKVLKPVKAKKAPKLFPRTPKSKVPVARPAKPAAVQIPSATPVTPEAEVVIKTHKWSAANLKQFRERLQRLHDLAVDDIGFLGGGRAGGVVSNLNGDGQTTEEDGTDNFVQDLALMQMSNKQDMLNKIIDAFRRLDERTYGLCEECGVLIAEARLQVQPFATMCIKCQSASEANRPRKQGFRQAMTVGQMVENDPSESA